MLHPNLNEAAQCLEDAEVLLALIKSTRKNSPTRFLADAQQKEHYRLNIVWELLLSAKAALNRADERGEGDTTELKEKHKRLKSECKRLDIPT